MTSIPVRSSNPEERSYLVGLTAVAEAQVSRFSSRAKASLRAAFTELELNPLPGPYRRPFPPDVERELREDLKTMPPGFELLSYHYGWLLIYYVLHRKARIVVVVGVREALYM